MENTKRKPRITQYSFDCPLLFLHPEVNGGAPLTARFSGGQAVTIGRRGDITIKRFSACLTLPAYKLELRRGKAANFSQSSISVTLAPAREFSDFDIDHRLLNKARPNRRTGMLEGLIGLKAELPGDKGVSLGVLPFSCMPGKQRTLLFGGYGRILTGLYAASILACCGIKTPRAACTVTIATTTPATKTVTGNVLGVSGLVQQATASAGHAFTAGPLPITNVKYWRNGNSMARPGITTATINAAGVITYGNFSIGCPISWVPIRTGDVAEFEVTVTDVSGDTGSQFFAHIF